MFGLIFGGERRWSGAASRSQRRSFSTFLHIGDIFGLVRLYARDHFPAVIPAKSDNLFRQFS